MDAAPNDAPLRESYLRPPDLVFGGLPGLALAARLCRHRLDDGRWTGLAEVARKLGPDDSYAVKGSADWKARCPCEAVHVLPPRKLVTCECERLFMSDGDAVWMFELGPQDET